MPALYTITTRASGTILTAAIYNTDHQNHVNNGDAQHLGGFSANTSQMRTQTSPGDVGSESLALSISDELARIRYMIALQRGTTFWYGTTPSYPGGGGINNYLRNSNFLTGQRMGQASQSYAPSAGNPYTFDQWYVSNGPNQNMIVFGYNTPLYANDIYSMGVRRVPAQTGTGSMWIGQPFTLAQLVPLLGKQVTASVSFVTGANFSSLGMQLQIITGTGTACKSAASFTNVASPVNINQVTTPSMPLTRISASGTIPTNATQMEWRVIWNPVGTAGAADDISIAQAKLELGTQMTPYIPPDPYAELQELSAFYWKSFPLGILPAQNAGQNGAVWMNQATAASVANVGNTIRWPTRMIKAPTCTLYNPAAVNAQARNPTVPADCTLTSITQIDESGGLIAYTAAAGSIAGHNNMIQITADAGL